MIDNQKEFNPFTLSVLKVFAHNPFEPYNHKQVSSRLGAYDKATKELVQKTIYELHGQDILQEVERGKFQLNPSYVNDNLLPQSHLVGVIEMKQTGKGYVIPENNTIEDIYIAPNNTLHAFNGDRVKVFLFPKRKSHKPEGQVVEVLQRVKTRFVGRIQLNKHMAFFTPDNKNVPVDFLIPLEDLQDAQDGDKVLVELTEWHERSKNPFGKVIEVLGKPGDNNVEMMSILAELDFPLSFPKEVEKAAETISTQIPAAEIKKRRDLRDLLTFTIDPEDAKDFDDAISYRKLENGNQEVGVHIADVSYYVTPDSAIDKEAYNRGTSIYLVDRTIPMLPEKLCNGVCSLRPNEDKLSFSAIFELNDKAEVINQWFGKTVINSKRRFTYQEAQDVIETEEGDCQEEILATHHLASILRKERFKNGAINFETKEIKFRLDENGKPIGVYIKEQKEANFLIEEFMLLANRKVAEHVGRTKNKQTPKTFVYRVHDQPNPEKLNTFIQFVNKLGYRMKIASRQALADSFNNLFENIAGKGEENMIETIAIRTMAKAFYSTENIGHYGLGFPFYSHFTSPIRRYPDLMVHRLLEHYLENGSSANANVYEEMCKHTSLMEKKAAEAERTSVKYKQVEYLSDKIGQEFDAKISGVSKWGIYAEITENGCEGMIPLGTLADDYYYLDEDNYQVIGRRYHKQYKLGDSIRIRVLRVDLGKRQMDFEYVDLENPNPTPRENADRRPFRESGKSRGGKSSDKPFGGSSSSKSSGKPKSSSPTKDKGKRKKSE